MFSFGYLVEQAALFHPVDFDWVLDGFTSAAKAGVLWVLELVGAWLPKCSVLARGFSWGVSKLGLGH